MRCLCLHVRIGPSHTPAKCTNRKRTKTTCAQFTASTQETLTANCKNRWNKYIFLAISNFRSGQFPLGFMQQTSHAIHWAVMTVHGDQLHTSTGALIANKVHSHCVPDSVRVKGYWITHTEVARLMHRALCKLAGTVNVTQHATLKRAGQEEEYYDANQQNITSITLLCHW